MNRLMGTIAWPDPRSQHWNNPARARASYKPHAMFDLSKSTTSFGCGSGGYAGWRRMMVHAFRRGFGYATAYRAARRRELRPHVVLRAADAAAHDRGVPRHWSSLRARPRTRSNTCGTVGNWTPIRHPDRAVKLALDPERPGAARARRSCSPGAISLAIIVVAAVPGLADDLPRTTCCCSPTSALSASMLAAYLVRRLKATRGGLGRAAAVVPRRLRAAALRDHGCGVPSRGTQKGDGVGGRHKPGRSGTWR